MKTVKLLFLVFSVLLLSNSIFAYGRTVPLSDRVQKAEKVFGMKPIQGFLQKTRLQFLVCSKANLNNLLKLFRKVEL
jgi:hypothetical protein